MEKTQKTIQDYLRQKPVRLGLWLLASLAISFIFFRDFWASLPRVLTPDWLLGQHHAAPWGVLGLCAIWVWLKRKQIVTEMETKSSLLFVALGVMAIALAILSPESADFTVFRVLLASVGAYATLMGKGARIPAILLGIYGFVAAFPPFVERFVETPYSLTAIVPLLWIINLLGLPFASQGQLMQFTSASGEQVSVTISAACAGPTTMAVFLAIFALMMLDMPLPPRKIGWLLAFGVTGTWLQSIIRLVIIMLVGYRWGREALFTAHGLTIYFLFPIWYLVFAYVYFRQAGPRAGSRPELEKIPATGVADG